MAQEWCLYYGVIRNSEQAEKLYKIVCKRKGKDVMSPSVKKEKSKSETPVKAQAKKAKTETGKHDEERRKKKRNIHVDEDEIENDTGFEAASGWEQQGRSGI